ncbi:MAG: clostripain-related cysteine peptidase [bacterium]
MKLHSIFFILILICLFQQAVSDVSGAASPPSPDEALCQSSPAEVRVPAVVTVYLEGRQYSASADQSGCFEMPLAGRTPRQVSLKLTFRGENTTVPAWVMQRSSQPHGDNHALWNVILFLDSSEDLERYQERSLALLEELGGSRQVRVLLALLHPSGRGFSTRFYQVRKPEEVPLDFSDGVVMGRVVLGQDGLHLIQSPACSLLFESRGLAATDPGEALRCFLSFCTTYFPSARRLLVLSLHGEAFRGLRAGGGTSGVEKEEVISLIDLKNILLKFPGLEILGFDACRMATVEVAMALEGALAPDGVMIASPQDSPARGWPLSMMVRALKESPDCTAGRLADMILSAYAGEYGRLGYSSETLSILKVSGMSRLRASLETLSHRLKEELRVSGGKTMIMEARQSAAVYSDSSYIDIGIFAEETALKFSAAPSARASRQVLFALNEAVATSGAKSVSSGRGFGLTVYFPDPAASRNEEEMRLYREVWENLSVKERGWPDFVRALSPFAGGEEK